MTPLAIDADTLLLYMWDYVYFFCIIEYFVKSCTQGQKKNFQGMCIFFCVIYVTEFRKINHLGAFDTLNYNIAFKIENIPTSG